MCLTFGLNFVTWYEFMDFYLCCANYEGSIIQPMICAYQIFLPVANHNSITADLERGDGASLFRQGQFFWGCWPITSLAHSFLSSWPFHLSWRWQSIFSSLLLTVSYSDVMKRVNSSRFNWLILADEYWNITHVSLEGMFTLHSWREISFSVSYS